MSGASDESVWILLSCAGRGGNLPKLAEKARLANFVQKLRLQTFCVKSAFFGHCQNKAPGTPRNPPEPPGTPRNFLYQTSV